MLHSLRRLQVTLIVACMPRRHRDVPKLTLVNLSQRAFRGLFCITTFLHFAFIALNRPMHVHNHT
ncbi:hypothetical protein BT63DRAFT_280517 [Microthyrium microscopicum]|uniref:Uncharacterized protein n=1 Tax=Microthyrium microscopicum TaxID=703497 RepID=A0A6A6UBT7_9PEZI|nr:hypothetical protein BT63DRAFT_280517 [Microthyrium microscopicum]